MDFQTSKFREITTKTPDPHDSSKTLELNWFTDLDEKSLIVEESTIKRITDPEFANSVASKTPSNVILNAFDIPRNNPVVSD